MVEQRLRSMGLRLGGRPRADDGVRRPRGAPPPARAGWEEYLVAVKPVGETWPLEAAARINQARHCYEAGTHEMCQTTTKTGWTMLYCIPRKRAAERRHYFTLRVA